MKLANATLADYNGKEALGDATKALQVEEEFKQAWKYADIPAPIPLLTRHRDSARF